MLRRSSKSGDIWGKRQFIQELLQPEGKRNCWQFTTYAIYILIYVTVALKKVAYKYLVVFQVTRHSNQSGQPLLDRKQVFLLLNIRQGKEKENGKGKEKRKEKRENREKRGEKGQWGKGEERKRGQRVKY